MKKLVIASLLALSLCACGEKATSQDNSSHTPAPAQAKATKTVYKVAVEEDTPFMFFDEKGQPTGFDVELLNAIAQVRGFEVQYEPKLYKQMFESLQAGQTDIVASGIYVTEERAKLFDFSEPYMQSGTGIAIRKGEPITKLKDLNDKKIAAKQGTIAEKVSLNVSKNVRSAGTHWLAFKDLMNTQADVMVGDSATISYYIAQYKDQNLQMITPDDLPRENYAFLVQKGNQQLAEELNKGLAELKANGTLEKLLAKWFG